MTKLLYFILITLGLGLEFYNGYNSGYSKGFTEGNTRGIRTGMEIGEITK